LFAHPRFFLLVTGNRLDTILNLVVVEIPWPQILLETEASSRKPKETKKSQVSRQKHPTTTAVPSIAMMMMMMMMMMMRLPMHLVDIVTLKADPTTIRAAELPKKKAGYSGNGNHKALFAVPAIVAGIPLPLALMACVGSSLIHHEFGVKTRRYYPIVISEFHFRRISLSNCVRTRMWGATQGS
jgi:hypothetical protein